MSNSITVKHNFKIFGLGTSNDKRADWDLINAAYTTEGVKTAQGEEGVQRSSVVLKITVPSAVELIESPKGLLAMEKMIAAQVKKMTKDAVTDGVTVADAVSLEQLIESFESAAGGSAVPQPLFTKFATAARQVLDSSNKPENMIVFVESLIKGRAKAALVAGFETEKLVQLVNMIGSIFTSLTDKLQEDLSDAVEVLVTNLQDTIDKKADEAALVFDLD